MTYLLFRAILQLELDASALTCHEHDSDDTGLHPYLAIFTDNKALWRVPQVKIDIIPLDSGSTDARGQRYSTSTGHLSVTSPVWSFHATPTEARTSYRILASPFPKSMVGGEDGGSGSGRRKRKIVSPRLARWRCASRGSSLATGGEVLHSKEADQVLERGVGCVETFEVAKWPREVNSGEERINLGAP